MKSFSVQTITALTDVVTGGSGMGPRLSIGLYRTGPQLVNFFGGCGLELNVTSRVPSVNDLLSWVNKQPDGHAKISEVIEAAADPRDFFDEPEKLEAVVEYLNKRLKYDGYELQLIGNIYRLVNAATNAVASSALQEIVGSLDLESVKRDFDAALTLANTNPRSTIRAACSTVESVCKCILDEMNEPYPSKQDIKGLVAEVSKHLNLSPGRKDLSSEVDKDIKQILSGLVSVTAGIGALRTHASDAHGRGKRAAGVDSRIARLAIHAASTVSLFYIETWQRLGSTTTQQAS